MLDLFSGSGSASRSAAVRGWEVVRIDNGAGTAADIKADLSRWSPPPELGPFDLVWASPPCHKLSTAGRGRDVDAGLVLVRAALRIIGEIRPRWWVLENVHGATRAIGDLIGPPVACYGSFYLWGCFPPFAAHVPREKTKLSGRRRAERRAAIPWPIADGLVRACEALARELAPPGAGGGLVGAWSERARAAAGARGGQKTAENGETGRSTSAPAAAGSTERQREITFERPASNTSGRSGVSIVDERGFASLVISELPACTTCNRIGHLAADCPNDEGGSRGKS